MYKLGLTSNLCFSVKVKELRILLGGRFSRFHRWDWAYTRVCIETRQSFRPQLLHFRKRARLSFRPKPRLLLHSHTSLLFGSETH